MSERLFTLAGAALELGCSVSTVKRRIAAGGLPAFVDGRLVRVREADLRRYVLERVARQARAGSTATVAGSELARGSRLWD